MRLLVCGLLLFSFTVHSQTRVKENIKQQAVAVSEDGVSKPVVRIPKTPPKKKVQ